jgi:hypothetical protein
LINSNKIYGGNEIALLNTISSLKIIKTKLEPTDNERNWIYRITYNPSEIFKNSNEIVFAEKGR